MPLSWFLPVRSAETSRAKAADVTVLWIVVLVVAAVGLVAWLVMRSRSADTSVDSFRRQIDALGPEARRNVVDQVNNAAENELGDDDADEGGTRGT